jgi:hypothetical protein
MVEKVGVADPKGGRPGRKVARTEKKKKKRSVQKAWIGGVKKKKRGGRGIWVGREDGQGREEEGEESEEEDSESVGTSLKVAQDPGEGSERGKARSRGGLAAGRASIS